ncbi:MAG: hypothetical protein WCK82_12870 [Bacteroidota bacterium]|jgi:hypothetical protein
MLTTYAFIALYVFWCGYVWTLRGGGFGALVRKYLKFEPGTTLTRISCALLMAAPLAAFFGPYLLVLWLSIYGAMTLGYFDESMGLEQPGRDHLFLALWGWVVGLVALLPLYTSFDSLHFNLYGSGRTDYALNTVAQAIGALRFTAVADVASLGVLAVVAYAANKPLGRRFGTDWTERGEFCTGLVVGTALVWAALIRA